MSSRRISSYNDIKPIQAITVDAFSKFNSENVNRLTRIVSKSGDNDVVVNGLDIVGLSDNNFHIISNNLLDGVTWTCSNCNFSNNTFTFINQNTDNGKYYDYAECSLDSNHIPHSGIYNGYFQLKFQLLNGCPTYTTFNLNKHVLNLKRLDGFGTDSNNNGWYTLVFQYNFHFDKSFIFRVGIFNDTNDTKTKINNSIKIKNISLRQIFDNEKFDYYLSEEGKNGVFGDNVVHPLHQLKVTPGVAIKDNLTLDILKSNFSDNLSSVILTANDSKSWITGNRYHLNDFSKNIIRPQNIKLRNESEFTTTGYFVNKNNGKISLFTNTDSNQYVELQDDFYTDSNYDINITSLINWSKLGTVIKGSCTISDSKNESWVIVKYNNKIISCYYNPGNSVSIDIDTSDFKETIDVNNLTVIRCHFPLKVSGIDVVKSITKWAYVVIKQSYFKDHVPNKSYIGFIKEEELFDEKYREDYLILAKVRFVDCETFDIITYSNSRQDLGVITAEDVNYYVTCKTGEIWNDDVPVTVTDALDILRLKGIENYLKEKYKHDYDAEISDTFNLVKDNISKIKTNFNIGKTSQETNHLKRITTNDTKLVVTDIFDPQLIESGLTTTSIFTLNNDKTYYLSTDNKWAISSDFKYFGEYDSVEDTVPNKYLAFNKIGPFTFVDKHTKLNVVRINWLYDEINDLLISTSPKDINDTTNYQVKIAHSKSEFDSLYQYDPKLVSYTDSTGSRSNSSNNNKNHQQYLIFRSKFIDGDYLSNLMYNLPVDKLQLNSSYENEVSTIGIDSSNLIHKRVLFGYIGKDNKVHIQSSNHELDENMINQHVLISITHDDNHKIEKSSNIIFDNDLKTDQFLFANDVSKEHDKSTIQITSNGYYYKNLQDNNIAVSNEDDTEDKINIECDEYDIDDLVNKYWYFPKLRYEEINSTGKLIVTIDSEKNFIIRVSQLIDFLLKNENANAKDLINKDTTLTNKKLLKLNVEIDCTKSKNRQLKKLKSDDRFFYDILEKYFTSRLMLVNDMDEKYIDESDKTSYFNVYVDTVVSLYYLENNQKIFFDNNRIYWKDDRRGYNNRLFEVNADSWDEDRKKNLIENQEISTIDDQEVVRTTLNISNLSLYPAVSKNKINETVATKLPPSNSDNFSTLNAESYARGNIRHTYAGCQTEYTFRYLKKFPSLPESFIDKYDIDTTINDILLCTSDYYDIPNIVKIIKPIDYDADKMNWIFTTNKGVISVIREIDIVSDNLENLNFYKIKNQTNYSNLPQCTDSDQETIISYDELETDTYKTGHIRYHIFEDVNNNNNSCISLTPNSENTDEYRWVLSFDGNTGIWRSQDMIGKEPFRLISTSSKLNNGSTTFDVKKMVSWRNGNASDQCLIALSTQNESNRSTVEVIPYNCIFPDSEGNEKIYITNDNKLAKNNPDAGLCYSSFWSNYNGNDKEGLSDEWTDHLLVHDISIANVDGEDIMIYLGKQRKDKLRFPPDDYNNACTDTIHHASVLNNGISTGSKKKINTVGFDVSQNSMKLDFSVRGSCDRFASLDFNDVTAGQIDKASQSTSNVIFSMHLNNGNSDEIGNRFLSVGSANNYCTGIDWELSNYLAYSKNKITKNTSIDKSKDKLSNFYGQRLSKYGIFKKVYEFNGVVYITTTNGIVKINNFMIDKIGDEKFISFEDELKHTKWDDLPYNYRYSYNDNKCAWLSSQPMPFILSNDKYIIDRNTKYTEGELKLTQERIDSTSYCKLKDGCLFICGTGFAGIYNRDGWTYTDFSGDYLRYMRSTSVKESGNFDSTNYKRITTLSKNCTKCNYDELSDQIIVTANTRTLSEENYTDHSFFAYKILNKNLTEYTDIQKFRGYFILSNFSYDSTSNQRLIRCIRNGDYLYFIFSHTILKIHTSYLIYQNGRVTLDNSKLIQDSKNVRFSSNILSDGQYLYWIYTTQSNNDVKFNIYNNTNNIIDSSDCYLYYTSDWIDECCIINDSIYLFCRKNATKQIYVKKYDLNDDSISSESIVLLTTNENPPQISSILINFDEIYIAYHSGQTTNILSIDQKLILSRNFYGDTSASSKIAHGVNSWYSADDNRWGYYRDFITNTNFDFSVSMLSYCKNNVAVPDKEIRKINILNWLHSSSNTAVTKQDNIYPRENSSWIFESSKSKDWIYSTGTYTYQWNIINYVYDRNIDMALYLTAYNAVSTKDVIRRYCWCK